MRLPWSSAKSPDEFLTHTRTRAVLERAQLTSRRLQSGYVSPAHLLLAILEEDTSDSFAAMARLGIAPEELRALLERAIQADGQRSELLSRRRLPYTSRAVSALQHTATEASGQRSANPATPEDLFLAILSDERSSAAQACLNAGVTRPRVAASLHH